jgi:SagB-type dehydrogenase family enzyme
MYGSLSQVFHENTKQFPLTPDRDEQKHLFPFYNDVVESIHFKSYPRFKKIQLQSTFPKRRLSIQQTILNSPPIGQFGAKKIALNEISELIFHSAGIIDKEKGESEEAWNRSRRSYPSSGARYPLETYVVLLRSSGIEPGIYHYNVKHNTLELISQGDYTNQIIHATHNQKGITDASMIVLLSAVFKRTEIKYGDRGYRYVLLEAGHLAQSIYLIANSMNLYCYPCGEFFDDELNELLDLDGTYESVIYMVVVGAKHQNLAERIRSLRFV